MSNIKLFESKKIRSSWNQDEEKWYFSIVNVVEILTESPNARKYWSVLKTRLKAEGSQLATNCSQLKMQSADKKFYLTDVADTEKLLRLIQSIPSPKAEPFKQWLARVGFERIEESQDPEISIENSLEKLLNIYLMKIILLNRHYERSMSEAIYLIVDQVLLKRLLRHFEILIRA